MVKLILASLIGGLLGGQPLPAQTTPAKKAEQRPGQTKGVTVKRPATGKSGATEGPEKKGGGLDMRYKANKESVKSPPIHTKKDRTPDMRYKENKERYAARSSTSKDSPTPLNDLPILPP